MKMNSRSKMRAWPAILAGLFAVMCSASHAQSFPSYPLQTGAGDVAPNIMFILDDSGSMADDVMRNQSLTQVCRRSSDTANSCASGSGGGFDISNGTYTSNTLYYDPATTYQAWMQSNGVRMTGGTSFDAAYGSFNFASGVTIDLANSSSCGYFDNNGNRIDGNNSGQGNNNPDPQVCGGVQTFYVPKSGMTGNQLRNATNYWRYQIRTMSGETRVVRSDLLNSGSAGGALATAITTPLASNLAFQSGTDVSYYFLLQDGDTFSVNMTGTGNARLTIYDPSGSNICDPNNNTSNENCNNYTAVSGGGEYRARIRRTASSGNVNVTYTVTNSNGCAASGSNWSWRNCTFVDSPVSGRSLSAELINYATWFSYHRTRMKLAKAGASEAFAQLSDNVRVGYRSIHDRSNYDIPVGVDTLNNNDGVFKADARTTWFNRLFAAAGQSGTPLHRALDGVGQYYQRTGNDGPYGPAVNGTQLACRQNFAILTTDGYWNSYSSLASADRPGDQDGTNGPLIVDHSLPTTDPNYNVRRYTPAHPYRDGANNTNNRSNTLADVAMKYWKNDLRPGADGLDNLVPTSGNNPAFWQHMVTFGISIGLKGTVDQTSVSQFTSAANRPRINGVNVNWPDPDMDNTSGTAEIAARIDDLLHAAVNGRGEFIAATNATDFRDALNSVLGQIQARLASGSNVATNSTSFQSDTRMYQATYTTKVWSGDIVARDVTRVGGISSAESWRVSQRINANYDHATAANRYYNRTVLTWNGTAGTSFPTAAQTALLERTSTAPGQPPAVGGAENAAYIKGSRALELSGGIGRLRNRPNLLGDIINSSPAYNRTTEMLYVGANDGMLHGVNALTGDVRFSYVPAGLNFRSLDGSGNINGGLTLLSDPAYEHQFFVDGPVALSGSQISADTTYLVATLGRGGKGAFALNVSAPASFSAASVLWDRTATPDNDMGYVLGLPLIVKGNDGSNLAIVPNGIDSVNGDAVLYVYNIATGAQLAKIAVGETGGNGLSSPRAADLDGNGTVDYVYAGDMLGNVWKFDLTSSNASDWNVAQIEGLRQPLFTATDSGGNRQPITGGVAIARNPDTGDIWVTFGTGKLIVQSDLGAANSGVQSLYGVADRDESLVRADLTTRTIPAVGTDAQGRSIRAFERFALLPSTSSGWVIDMGRPTAGERVISGARINGRAVFISSVIPIPGSGCEDFGGGYLNVLDAFTGTSARTSGDGDSSFFDLDGDGSGADETIVGEDGQTYYIGSIDLGIGMPTESGQIENMVLVCGTGGVCAEENLMPQDGGPGQPRRISWRELVNDD